MTEREAAIVSAYTGYLCGGFAPMYRYIEEILGRPVFTHELANEHVFQEIHDKSKPDFVGLEITQELQG